MYSKYKVQNLRTDNNNQWNGKYMSMMNMYYERDIRPISTAEIRAQITCCLSSIEQLKSIVKDLEERLVDIEDDYGSFKNNTINRYLGPFS